jgi:hypothetical protein
MTHSAHAEAAVQALGGKFAWPGAEWPFQVQPYNAPPGAAGGQGQQQRGGGGGAFAPPPPAQTQGGLGLDDFGGAPPGCAPDAYPLTLINLPPLVDEAELRSLLSAFGRLARLDLAPGAAGWGGGGGGPMTGAVASVWFAGRGEADAAAAALNGGLLRSAGEEPRQLQVHAGRGAAGAAGGGGDAGLQGLRTGGAGAGLGGGVGLLDQQQQLGADSWGMVDSAGLASSLRPGFVQNLLGGGGGLAADSPWQQPWQAATSAPFNTWGTSLAPALQQHQPTQLGAPFSIGPDHHAPLLGAVGPPQAQQQQQHDPFGLAGPGAAAPRPVMLAPVSVPSTASLAPAPGSAPTTATTLGSARAPLAAGAAGSTTSDDTPLAGGGAQPPSPLATAAAGAAESVATADSNGAASNRVG